MNHAATIHFLSLFGELFDVLWRFGNNMAEQKERTVQEAKKEKGEPRTFLY